LIVRVIARPSQFNTICTERVKNRQNMQLRVNILQKRLKY